MTSDSDPDGAPEMVGAAASVDRADILEEEERDPDAVDELDRNAKGGSVSLLELAAHDSEEAGAWLAIGGVVYNVTEFLYEHPGGGEILLENCGSDATVAFEDIGHSEKAQAMLIGGNNGIEVIGNLAAETETKERSNCCRRLPTAPKHADEELQPEDSPLIWAQDAQDVHDSEAVDDNMPATDPTDPTDPADGGRVADIDRWLVALCGPLLIWFVVPCVVMRWDAAFRAFANHWPVAILLLCCGVVPVLCARELAVKALASGSDVSDIAAGRTPGGGMSFAVVCFMLVGAALFVAAKTTTALLVWVGTILMVVVLLCWCGGVDTILSVLLGDHNSGQMESPKCCVALSSCVYAVSAGACAILCAGLILTLSLAAYLAPMTLVPTLLLTSGSASKAAGGAAVFVSALWTLGWALLWYKWPRLKAIEPKQHLVGMPSESLALKLKPFAMAYECYNYCGFSFFPALPWKTMEVPPAVPHPQKIMLAGFFEFEDVDTQLLSFIGCAATVAIALVLLLVTRNDTASNLLVLQIFFELLSFPLIKKLTSVFSCTSSSVWEDNHGSMQLFCALNTTEALENEWEYELSELGCDSETQSINTWSECEAAAAYLGLSDKSVDNTTDFSSTWTYGCYYDTFEETLLWASNITVQHRGEDINPLCIHPYNEDVQCMDNDPTTECWEPKHLTYVLVSMVLLVPYYLLTLHKQLEAQKRQSAVVVDGVWTVVSLQNKFALAVIASAFGDCYPHVIVVAVELSVIGQLWLMCVKSYSSVLKLNAIRFGGLLCAAIDGMYALFVLIHYADDPRAHPPCMRTWNGTNLDGSDGSDTHANIRLVDSYTAFFCLLGANGFGVLCGLGYYLAQKYGWQICGCCAETSWAEESRFKTWTSINGGKAAQEVDYPIVRSRLDSLSRLVKWAAVSRAEELNRETVKIDRKHCCVTRSEYTKVSELNSIEVDDLEPAAEQLGLYMASPKHGRPADKIENTTFDLHLYERESGQALESVTLDAVLGSKLLSYPLGVNLLDVDLTRASGLMVCDVLSKIGGRAKHWGCGSAYCSPSCPFLHLGKSKPVARIASVEITNLDGLPASDTDKLLSEDFFIALGEMGPCKVYIHASPLRANKLKARAPAFFLSSCEIVAGPRPRLTAENNVNRAVDQVEVEEKMGLLKAQEVQLDQAKSQTAAVDVQAS